MTTASSATRSMERAAVCRSKKARKEGSRREEAPAEGRRKPLNCFAASELEGGASDTIDACMHAYAEEAATGKRGVQEAGVEAGDEVRREKGQHEGVCAVR